MVNTSFKLEFIKDDEKKEVEIVLQEINKATVVNMSCENAGKGGRILVADFIKACVENGAIVSPKNLIEQLEEVDNGVELYVKIFNEVNTFCPNPKKYALLQKESIAKSSKQNKPVGDSV